MKVNIDVYATIYGVIEMYAIIFWEDGDSIVKPLLNKDGTLTLFDVLTKADRKADSIESIGKLAGKPVEARVISIDGVSE